MLSFRIKNKKNVKQKSEPAQSNDAAQQKEENLKHEMISSILKETTYDSEKTVTLADANQNIVTIKDEKSSPVVEKQQNNTQTKITNNNEKISQLIKAIESTNFVIEPSIDLTQGHISYPILSQIGEKEDNVEFLENLASPSMDILEKIIYERIAVCPKHSDSLGVNVRLYCPRCVSMNIEKLHLIEHKRCGYISEKINFESTPDGVITKCPSCKKTIGDTKKEIGIPAMWYRCSDCKEKFDDVSIKLHCRKFNHDFDISQSHTITIPGYTLKNLADNSNSSIAPILDKLKKLLGSYGFSSEENYSVTGKSGNQHNINICGFDEQNRTVFIFVKNPNAENDNFELNSKIIAVLDTSPTVSILIGFPSISEKAKAIASNYHISLVSDQQPDAILSSIDKILSEKITKVGV